MARSPSKRFWEKVSKKEDGCWLWTAKRAPNGYGMFWAGPAVGRQVGAHRWVYEDWFGPIPDGLVVMHSCDVKHCVNPAHLSTGRQQDNVDDMIAKGRKRPMPHGEASPNAKLTWAIVDAARKRHKAGESGASLAREFGVHNVTMCKALRGATWKRPL